MCGGLSQHLGIPEFLAALSMPGADHATRPCRFQTASITCTQTDQSDRTLVVHSPEPGYKVGGAANRHYLKLT